MAIHQFLPSFSGVDAQAHHVLRVQSLLRSLGESEIFVELCDPSLRSLCSPYESYTPARGDVAFYHMSIGTPLSSWILSLPIQVVVDYHNITPVHFFAPYESRVASLLLSGRSECRALARIAAIGIAHSDYSARELAEMGYRHTATIPILIDWSRYERPPDPTLLERLQRGKKGTDILYVSRIAPHKKQEDVIKVFAAYKRHYDPAARLYLVGSSASQHYSQTLESFIERISIPDVFITGPLRDEELYAHYTNADVFLSMSEHEGFGVPYLEAAYLGVPVIAFAAAAIPEIVGDGGILIREKKYEEVAALIYLVTHEPDARDRIVKAGKERVKAFRPEIHESRLLDLMRSLADQ